MPSLETGFSSGAFTGQTLEASFTSEAFVCGQNSKLGIQLVLSNNDAVGTLKIQESIDGSNWVDVPFTDSGGTLVTSISVTSGNDVNAEISIPEATGSQYRVVYTRTSGDNTNTLAGTALSKRN